MTNENMEFDFEWAKRGGVIRLDAGDDVYGLLKAIDGVNIALFIDGYWHLVTIEITEMLSELRKDKERLEFVFESGLSIKHSESGYWFSNTGIVYACDIYPNPRGAIDAVMKGGV